MLAPIIFAIVVGLIAPSVARWFFKGLTIIGAFVAFAFLYIAVTAGFAIYALETIK